MAPLWRPLLLWGTTCTLASNIGVYKLKRGAGSQAEDIEAALDCARCNHDPNKCKVFELEEVSDDFTQINNMTLRILRVDNAELTWFDAKKRCAELGADLLTLETPEKRLQFVSNDKDIDLFKHWTSLSNTENTSEFKWISGQEESLSRLNISVSTFSPQSCVYIHLRIFGILPCDHKKGYVCQRNKRLKRSATCKVNSSVNIQ